MSTDDRIQSIIDATFADKDLAKRAKTAKPADLSESIKILGNPNSHAQQPAMSTWNRSPKRDERLSERLTKTQRRMDQLQMGLDAVGIADPSPIADGANAAISVGRMFTDPKRRGEHAKNAAISAVSMIPYAGDLAKLAKTKRYRKTIRGIGGDGDAARGMRDRRFADGVDSAGSGGGSGGGDGGAIPPGSADGSDGRDRREEEEGIEEMGKWTTKLKSTGKAILAFAGPIGVAAGAAVGFVKSVEKMNTGILAANRGLGNFNGQIAEAYAKYDVREIERDIKKGGAMDGSIAKLAKEQSDFRDDLERWMTPISIALIEMQVLMTKMTGYSLKVVEALAMMDPRLALAVRALKALEKQNEDASTTGMEQFFADLSDGKFDGKKPDLKGGSTQILSDNDHEEVFGK